MTNSCVYFNLDFAEFISFILFVFGKRVVMELMTRIKSYVQAAGNEPFWKFLLLTGMICAVLLSFTFNAQPSEIDDNYHYMNLGRALYEGKGFVRLDTPGHPPEDIVTPGYPLILAGIMKIMGDPKPLIALKLFSTLCYLLTILIAVTIFVRIMNLPRWVAFAFAVFMSMSQFVVYYASYVLTEAPFMLFCALTVWFILLYERDKRDLFFYLATLSTVFGIYIRLPGAPLAVAVFAWLLLRKDYKKAIIFGAIVGGTVGAWVVPKLLEGRFRYGGQFVVKENVILESARTKSYFSRYFYNMGHYFFVVFPRLILPFISLLKPSPILFEFSLSELIVGLPLLAILVLGVIFGIREREKGFPYFFFAAYFFMIFFFASRGIRYSTYVFPWFMLAFVTGLGSARKFLKIGRILGMVISIILIAIIFVTSLPSFRTMFVETKATRQIARKGIKPPYALVAMKRFASPISLHRMYQASEWVRLNTPEDAVLMAAQLRTCYYYSERPCLSPEFWEEKIKGQGLVRERELRESEIDSMWLWALDNGVSHILVDPIYAVTKIYLRPALARYQDCIKLVYETPDPVSRVFEIDTTCLRDFLTNNSKAELDKLLREVMRLTEIEDRDSLKSLIARHEGNDAEVVSICKLISYYVNLEEFEDMLRLFDAAQLLYPDNPVLWFNFGIENNRLGLVEISVPAFEKALELGADSGDCYNNLGVAFTLKKDFETADVNFRKAMFHSDTDATIFKNRIANLITLKRISEADSLIEWANSRSSADSSYVEAIKSIKKTYENWKKSVGL